MIADRYTSSAANFALRKNNIMVRLLKQQKNTDGAFGAIDTSRGRTYRALLPFCDDPTNIHLINRHEHEIEKMSKFNASLYGEECTEFVKDYKGIPFRLFNYDSCSYASTAHKDIGILMARRKFMNGSVLMVTASPVRNVNCAANWSYDPTYSYDNWKSRTDRHFEQKCDNNNKDDAHMKHIRRTNWYLHDYAWKCGYKLNRIPNTQLLKQGNYKKNVFILAYIVSYY